MLRNHGGEMETVKYSSAQLPHVWSICVLTKRVAHLTNCATQVTAIRCAVCCRRLLHVLLLVLLR